MKSFLEHIKEEVLPSVQVADGGLDIEKPAVRAAINAAIAGVVSQPAVTPYVVFNRLSKLLAQYHIVLPKKFLEGDKGVEVFEIRQFGHKMGMTDSGEFINQVPTTHYLFLQYGIITPMGVTYAKPLVGGMFRVTARLVDKAELDKLLDMAEITMAEEAECRQMAAKAMAPKDPMHDVTSDPKKVGNKKAVATSEKKSLGEAPETMGDVAKSREGHPNVFHDQDSVSYKASADRMKSGSPAFDPHRTEIKRVDEDKDPCWKGYEMVGMKKKGGKPVPNCVPVKEENLDELYGKGSLPGIAAYHTKKSAESKEQMEKTRSGNKKLPVPKKVTDKVSAKDSAAKYHASQAKRAKGMMEEETLDEVSKGKAIRAYAAGSTYNYDDEHPKSDAIKGHIVRKFGKKAGEHADRAAYSSLYGRDNKSNRVDQLAHAKPSSEMRKTKSGKIHKQDVGAKKDEIKFRKSMKKFEKPRGHLPEETLAEKAPPGAKYERMVQHIKDRLSKDGLTKKEKGIAFATAWKARNREKGE